MQMAS